MPKARKPSAVRTALMVSAMHSVGKKVRDARQKGARSCNYRSRQRKARTNADGAVLSAAVPSKVPEPIKYNLERLMAHAPTADCAHSAACQIEANLMHAHAASKLHWIIFRAHDWSGPFFLSVTPIPYQESQPNVGGVSVTLWANADVIQRAIDYILETEGTLSKQESLQQSGTRWSSRLTALPGGIEAWDDSPERDSPQNKQRYERLYSAFDAVVTRMGKTIAQSDPLIRGKWSRAVRYVPPRHSVESYDEARGITSYPFAAYVTDIIFMCPNAQPMANAVAEDLFSCKPNFTSSEPIEPLSAQTARAPSPSTSVASDATHAHNQEHVQEISRESSPVPLCFPFPDTLIGGPCEKPRRLCDEYRLLQELQ